ncbi:ESPR-type extended signal peptide-containing protein [Dialister succinatiphilus]|uniref:ESPR-type extended signal peptide-containing protein n=2 Tax=Dialister succinatiphilus TaxID=487173 RepID=UPI003AAAAFB0
MNRVFKVIWSHARNAYVVVSEIALNHGKNTKGSAGAVHLKKALIAALLVSGTFGGALFFGGVDSYAVNLGGGGSATYDNSGNLSIGKGTAAEGDDKAGQNNTAIGTNSDTLRKDRDSGTIGQPLDGNNTKLVDGEGKATVLNRSTTASTGDKNGSIAAGYDSHAEGDSSTAIGDTAKVTNPAITYYADADGNKTTSQSDAAWYKDSNGNPTKVPQVFRDADGNTTTTAQYIHTNKDGTTEVTTDVSLADKDSNGNLKYNYKKSDNIDSLYTVKLYQAVSNSIAAGSHVTATGNNAVAVGYNSTAKESSVAIGDSTSADTNAIAVGKKALANGDSSLAAGNGAEASGDSATAIGKGIQASGTQATAVGAGSTSASGNASTAVGYTAKAYGDTSSAFGSNVTANGGGTAVGSTGVTANSGSAAFGIQGTTASGSSVAVGKSGTIASDNSMAVGSAVHAERSSFASGMSGTAAYDGSYASGMNGTTAYNGSIAIGSNVHTSSSSYASGMNDTTSYDNSVAVGSNVHADDSSFAAGFNSSAGTDGYSGNGTNIAVGSNTSANNGSSAYGINATANYKSLAIGLRGDSSNSAYAYGNSMAMGNNANATGYSTAIGNSTRAYSYSVALGEGAQAQSSNSTAVGYNSYAYGSNTTALGYSARATSQNAIAVGNGAAAHGDNAVALGSNATANEETGVAIGSSSTANVASGKTGLDPHTGAASTDTSVTWVSKLGAVSVGTVDSDGNATATRQINGVAAGTRDTDAVNLAQLKAMETKINMHYYSVNSTVTGTGSNYTNEGASGVNAMAAGPSASAKGDLSVAVGNGAAANGAHSVAVGNGAAANGTDAIALGTNAKAEGQGALVVGEHNSATGQNAIAFGGGYGKDEKGNTASAVASVAFGENTTAKAEGTVAFGYGTQAGSDRTDNKGKNYGQDAVAFGNGTKALGGRSLAFGENTVADYNDSVAFGNASKALSTGAVAFGSRTRALAQYSTAFGNRAVSAGNYATAFGTDTLAGVKTDASGAMWLTNGTKIDSNGNVAYTDGSGNTYAVENFQNVKNGQPSGEIHNYVVVKGTDGKTYIQDYHGDIHAVTLTKQADGTIKATASTDIAKGITLVTADPTSTNGYDFVDYDNATAFGESTKAINVNAMAFGKNSVASGENSLAFGEGSTASGNNSVAGLGGTASTSNSIALGKDTKANNKDNAVSVAIGENAEASGARSLAIGFGIKDKDDTVLTQTTASGESAVSIGTDTEAAGQHSIAMGSHAEATKDSSLAIGYDTHATEASAVAIGSGTKVNRGYGVAIGLSALAGIDESDPFSSGASTHDGSQTVAVGYYARATATNAAALGAATSANVDGGVALGYQSATTRSAGNKVNGVEQTAYLKPASVDSTNSTWTSTAGAVSVGNVSAKQSITRQITDVAAGSLDTDAVNVAQLKAVSGSHTAVTVNDKSNPTIATAGDNTYGDYAGGEADNLHIAAMKGTDGKLTYNIKLNDQLSIGKKGTDGTDGKVTVDTKGGTTVIIGHDGENGKDGKDGLFVRGDDGKDGKSGISITGPNGLDGKDGIDGTIGIAGKDGKDAVSISGKDGVGHIGLTGPKGADGKDGTSIDLSTDYRTKTLNPDKNTTVNGEEKASRIVYRDAKGDHEVATMDDGQKYAGDNYVAATDKEAEKNAIIKKLNERLDIKGGAKGNLTDANIGVNAVDGVLKVQLALKIDLTKDGSVTMGKTVVNNDGLKITNDGADETKNVTINGDKVSFGGIQVNNMGSGASSITGEGDNKVYKYDVDTNGANIGDVKKIAGNTSTELTARGLDFAGNNTDVTVHRDLGTKLTIKGEGTKEDANYSGENLKVIGNTNGTLTIVMDKDIKGNSLTVGEKGEKGSEGQPGRDGVDGKIGVNGKDGSAVVINGKDGSIGLNGKDGANGLTIRGANGAVGVDGTDGKDGKDGMTRIVYQDAKGGDHTVATMDDGQKYHGDFGAVANVALNHQVNIVGDVSSYNAKNPNSKVDEKDLTDGTANVGVVTTTDKDGNATLTIKLNRNLKGFETVAAGTNAVFGKQEVTNTGNGKETGDYVTGLDNKTWDSKTYVSGRAATEDQLHQAVSDLIGPGANGGFGLSANGGKVTQALGKTIAVNGDGTYKADGTEDKAGNISTSVDKGAIKVSLNRDLNIDSTTMEKTNDDGSKVTNKTTAEGSTITKTDANGKTTASTTINAGSLTVKDGDGTTTIGGGTASIGGVTINGKGESDSATNKEHTSTIKGLSNTTFDTTHLDQYNKSDRAATEGQLKDVYDMASKHTTVTVNGKDAPSTDGNLILKKDDKNGSANYDLALNNEITLGDKDSNGKLTVKSKDSTKSIITDGEKGTLTFKDGNNETSMKAADSAKGVDGTTDIKRVAIDNHTVATMDDGMQFAGDSGNPLKQKLNSTTNIKGGATGDLSDGNIGVVSDGNNTLTVKLAKDIKGLNSIEAATINATTVNSSTFNAGNTTMDNRGVTIKTGDSGRTITIKDGGVSMGGNQIHNVAPGTAPDDAVNVSQLNATNGVVNKLGSRINKVGAGAAALAALHPLDFDPDDKWDVAAGYGHYKNADAAAIGAFYQPNEDTMLSIGGSFGGGENMVNAGVSVKLGQGNHVSTSRVAMAKEIRDLRENVAKLNDVVNRQSALIDKLTGVNAGTIQDRGNDLFPDVPANHWAYEYVTALHKAGILEGYPDGTFSGDRMMTRYEFAAIVYRAIMAGAASNPALNRDGTLDKLAKEFSSEMKYIRIDTISKDRNGNPDIQRVRVIPQKQEKK